MDPASLTALCMGLLGPYFAAVGSSIATEAGKDIYQQGKHLFEFIKARFSREPDGGKAVRVLEDSASDPDLRSTLETKLLRLVSTDATFANELRQIIQSGPRQSLTQEEEAVARRIRMTNALGAGTQEIKQGKHATAEDVDFNIRHPGQP